MNFRPVFTHMEKLIRDQAFRDLKGSLCFTDGYDDFPTKMTPYKTAFVFVDDGMREITVSPCCAPGRSGRDDRNGHGNGTAQRNISKITLRKGQIWQIQMISLLKMVF